MVTSREIPKSLPDAKDANVLAPATDGALQRLQEQAIVLRQDNILKPADVTHRNSSASLTDFRLVSTGKAESSDLQAGLHADRPSINRDADGIIRSVEKGNTRLRFQYEREDGTIARNTKGEPILKSLTATIEGKTTTFTAEDLAKAGGNSLAKFKADGVTIEQSGDSAGKVKLFNSKDSSALMGFAEDLDGKIIARIATINEPNGIATHTFEYRNADKPELVTKITNTVHASNGQDFVWTNERVNESNQFIRTESTGELNAIKDINFNESGQMRYRGDSSLDNLTEQIFGKSWLGSGDLTEAKQHLIDIAGNRIFEGQVEKHLNRIIDRFDDQALHGIRRPTDDQIAATFRSIAHVLETRTSERRGAAAQVSDAQVAKNMEEFLFALENPKTGLYQGQIGSCALHSALTMETIAFPDKLARLTEKAYINGAFKGKKFSTFDLQGADGQMPWNHMAATWHGWAGEVANHLNSGYGGTTMPEVMKAFAKLGLPDDVPVRRLNERMTRAEFDRINKKYGGCLVLTYGDGHSQFQSGNYLYNHWKDPRMAKIMPGPETMEGRLTNHQLGLY